MRFLTNTARIGHGFVFGGMRILFLVILLFFIIGLIRRAVMIRRFKKAMKTGDFDSMPMLGPHGRMFMMRGSFTDDQAAGIVIRSLKKDGASDDEIRDTMTKRYGYSALKTDALLLMPISGRTTDR